ncbi:hypothetical protein CGL27_05895 [Streptomyces sp. 11-1-2]|nr:hypothetical protein CGL27_05895 [Streptomyces sp. 11-1-2]
MAGPPERVRAPPAAAVLRPAPRSARTGRAAAAGPGPGCPRRRRPPPARARARGRAARAAGRRSQPSAHSSR